jgi:plastocyanin
MRRRLDHASSLLGEPKVEVSGPSVDRRSMSNLARWERRLTSTILIGTLTLVLASCQSATRQPDLAGSICSESRDRVFDPGVVVHVNAENDPGLPAFVAAWIYAPGDVTARVGQVIDFTSLDPDSQHTAELDSGACGTDYLDYKASDALVFNVPGSYPFHCLVHGTSMTGTITVLR